MPLAKILGKIKNASIGAKCVADARFTPVGVNFTNQHEIATINNNAACEAVVHGIAALIIEPIFQIPGG